MQLLGCDMNYLKYWLAYQFVPGMTWENYGQIWHVDHVTPCAVYNLEDPNQQLLCFNWSNLRPCFVAENLTKSAKIDYQLIQWQCMKACQFMTYWYTMLSLPNV